MLCETISETKFSGYLLLKRIPIWTETFDHTFEYLNWLHYCYYSLRICVLAFTVLYLAGYFSIIHFLA